MKIELTMPLIKRLRSDSKPVGTDPSGALIFEPNPPGKDYIVYDASQEAPPGFGVRIAKKKTFVIRRKVNGKSIMPTVGNVADFMTSDGKGPLTLARAKAAAMALHIVGTGKNPNAEARKTAASELTVGQAFARHRDHLRTRTQRPATAETLRVVDRAIRKFVGWGWANRRVKDVTPEEIEAKFKEGQDAHPTANEQAFRWALAAVRWCIGMEELDAASANRDPLLRANPFMILILGRMFRSRDQVEKTRVEQNKRNPLTPTKTLGEFLEVAWSRKDVNDNETGVHYLVLMLLWGCRKSEHAPCQWGELLTLDARKLASHVMLDDEIYGPHVFFHGTKNGSNHRLPIGPMAMQLLRRRQASGAEEAMRRGFGSRSRMFVFPARSRQSKSGHYSDASSLLDSLRDEAGIERLTRHDLRRSFGALMAAIDVPPGIRSRFFNHADASVTDTYTKAEWALLREWMERIEQSILAKAPNVYNALKPVGWPMLAAPAPHVARAAKPRTGRPRKDSSPPNVASELVD